MDEIEYLGATSTLLSYNLFTYCEGNPVNRVDNEGQFALTAFVHLVFIVMMVVLIPTVAATVSSYIPKKDEDEMDRQDITKRQKVQDKPLWEKTPEKTTPPGSERVSGIDEGDDYRKKYIEGAVEEIMSRGNPSVPTISDNYNVNSRGSLGGELEYIFNRDKFELWD